MIIYKSIPVYKIQMSTVEIKTIYDIDTVDKLRYFINPELEYKQKTLLLDTKYRYKTLSGETPISSFKWLYSDDGIFKPGYVTTVGTISNIKKIKIYPVQFRRYWSNIYINILVNEFKTQSMTIGVNKNAHWIYDNQNNFNNVVKRNLEYTFIQPFNILESLSLTFIGDKTLTIPFDNDDGLVTPGNPTIVNLNNISMENKSYTVSISNFTTTTPDIDSDIINTINTTEFDTTYISATSFSIPIDTSLLILPAGMTIYVYFEYYRMQIPIKLYYIGNI